MFYLFPPLYKFYILHKYNVVIALFLLEIQVSNNNIIIFILDKFASKIGKFYSTFTYY